MRSRPVIDWIDSTTYGARMPRALWAPIGAAQVAVPPAEEQAAIVKYLAHANARIDKAITAKRRLITLLEEQRAAKLRYVVLREDLADRVDSGLHWAGDIPEGWNVRKLRSLFSYQGSGTTPASDAYFGGGYPWVMSGDLENGMVTNTSRTVTDAALCEVPSLRMHPSGSLVIAMYGATIGKTGILAVAASTNQACSVLSGPRTEVDVRFVQLILAVARPALQELGAGGGQPNINGDKVAQFRIPMPPNEEQQKIVVRANAAISEAGVTITNIEHEIGLLQEFRTRLVADVVTGQVDVRAVAATLPDAPEAVTDLAADSDEQLDDELAAAMEPGDE